MLYTKIYKTEYLDVYNKIVSDKKIKINPQEIMIDNIQDTQDNRIIDKNQRKKYWRNNNKRKSNNIRRYKFATNKLMKNNI